MTTHAVAALHAVEGLAARKLSTQRLIEEIVHRIVGVVEVDAFVAASTDPDTSLCLGAGLVYEMSHDLCKPFWEHEFLIPDTTSSSTSHPNTPARGPAGTGAAAGVPAG